MVVSLLHIQPRHNVWKPTNSEINNKNLKTGQKQKLLWRSAYQWSVLPLANWSHHSSQVGLPLLLILILRVPDQICINGLALIVAFQSIQLNSEKTEKVQISMKFKHCKIFTESSESRQTKTNNMGKGTKITFDLVPVTRLIAIQHLHWTLRSLITAVTSV